MNGKAELEQLLARADRAVGGDWGEPVVRSPAKLFAERLRRQGFLPSQEFVVRFMQRLRDCGIWFDARAFRHEFCGARHYRQVGSRFAPNIAIVRGIPVLYRSDGGAGDRVELLGVLREYSRPRVVPIPSPGRADG